MEQSISGLGMVEARIQLRGIRLPPQLWNSNDLPLRAEFLKSWGFNALILDAIDQPLIEPFHQDEDRPASWEKSLAEVSERLQSLGWWVMGVVPVQLDLGPQGPRNSELVEPIPCRQSPLHRRRILHRFESILKGMRGLEAIGIAVCEWPRCQCTSCKRITFEEEAAYYLRAFSAVMKRYASGLEFWVLPDSSSFGLLQEIRAEVPSGARFLVGPQDPEQKGGLLPLQTEEGLVLDLSIPSWYEWLDTSKHSGLLLDWEQEDEPRLLAAEVGNTSRFPVGLASLMYLAWRTHTGGPFPEAWLYRLLLPEDQWGEWMKWKNLNLLTRKRIHDHGLRMDSVPIELAKKNRGDGDSPFRPDLPTALRKTHERLDLEDCIRPLLKTISDLPEGVPIDSSRMPELMEFLSTLSDLTVDDSKRTVLDAFELRILENLRDRISLLLSESRAGSVWTTADIPDLNTWYELLRNEDI